MSTVHLRLSSDRAIQLKALADARGTTMSGLIDDLVGAELRAGTIPDATPGIRYARRGDKVSIAIEEATFTISTKDANVLAASLVDRNKLSLLLADGEADDVALEISNVGRSVELKVSGPFNLKRNFTPSVAADVARQMRAACI